MKKLKTNENLRIVTNIPFDFNIGYNGLNTPYNLTDINKSQESNNPEQLIIENRLYHGKNVKNIYGYILKKPNCETQNYSDSFQKINHRSFSTSIQSLIYNRPIIRITKNIDEKKSRIQSILINAEKFKRITSPPSQRYVYKKRSIRKHNTEGKLKTVKIRENINNEKYNNTNKIPHMNIIYKNKNFFDNDMTLKEFLTKETESIKLNHLNTHLNVLNNKKIYIPDNGYSSYNLETNKTNYTQIDNEIKPYSVKLFFERKIKKITEKNKNNIDNSIKNYKKFSVANNINGIDMYNSKKNVEYFSFRQNKNKSSNINDISGIIKNEKNLLKNKTKKKNPYKIKNSSKESSKESENRFKINKIFSTSLTNIKTNINTFFYSSNKIITKDSGSKPKKNKNTIKKLKMNYSSSDISKYKCKLIRLHKFKNNPLKQNNSFDNIKRKNKKENIINENKPLFTIRIKISDLVNQLNKKKENGKLKQKSKLKSN